MCYNSIGIIYKRGELKVKIINNINFNKKQLKNAVFESLTQAPENSVTGQFYIDSSNKLNIYNGTVWVKQATESYVTDQIQTAQKGLDPKESVVVVATTNVTPENTGGTIDGVSLSTGARVLLTSQTTTSENGIYIVGVGAWLKAQDASGSNLTVGAHTFNEKDGSGWVYVGGANEVWTKFSESTIVSAGTGISVSQSGKTFTVSVASSTPQKVTGFVPSGNVNAVITHSLGVTDVCISVIEASTNELVFADAVFVNNQVTLTFDVAPTSNQYRYIIIG